MKRMLTFAVLFGQLWAANRLAAGPLRLPLLAETTVVGDTVFLSNLLPPSAPEEMKRRAGAVPLGRTPTSGAARVYTRDTILQVLHASGFPESDFTVPATIAVRRNSNMVSPQAVWTAIHSAALRLGIVLSADAGPGSLQWLAPGPFTEENDTLEVREGSLDPLLNQARFLLRLSKHPQAPSFYVWCPVPGAPGNRLASVAPSRRSSGSTRDGELVNPRRMASLRLQSQNSFASLSVRPLQPGFAGQIIRVRIPRNGHTLQARVIALDLLEADF